VKSDALGYHAAFLPPPLELRARGDTQRTTEMTDGMCGLLSLYELEGRPGFEWVSCAKKAAATL